MHAHFVICRIQIKQSAATKNINNVQKHVDNYVSSLCVIKNNDKI